MGDISGKTVSQFTTSSLMGMGLGTLLTQFINISSIPQLLPTLIVLSIANLTTSYWSAKVIDEVYLNNQRAKLVFDRYFESNCQHMPYLQEVNAQERFCVPNFANMQRCKYIRFGEKTISQILTASDDDDSSPNYFTNSVVH